MDITKIKGNIVMHHSSHNMLYSTSSLGFAISWKLLRLSPVVGVHVETTTRLEPYNCHELWLEEPKANIAYTAQKDQLRIARRFKITWLLKDHSWWLFPTNQVWVSTWYMGWCVWTNRNSERWCHNRTWVLYSCPSTLAPTCTIIGLGPLQSLGNLVKT